MASYHEQPNKHAKHAKDTNGKSTEKGPTRGCEARPQVYRYIGHHFPLSGWLDRTPECQEYWEQFSHSRTRPLWRQSDNVYQCFKHTYPWSSRAIAKEALTAMLFEKTTQHRNSKLEPGWVPTNKSDLSRHNTSTE